MNKMQTSSNLGIVLVAGLGLLSACVGKVDVGDATDGSGGSGAATDVNPSGGSSGGPATGPTECAEMDALRRAGYDGWRALTNDFGALAGSVFVGYIEGREEDLTLTIGSDHTASLLVGEVAPPPDADGGYLCSDDLCFPEGGLDGLAEGGTYPVHGASFEDGRLLVPLQGTSAYDPWCVLQEPVAWEEACHYYVVRNDTTMWGDTCAIGEEVVDCQFFGLAETIRPCVCTSVDCFAGVESPEGTHLFDLRYEEAEDKLEGSLDGTNVHLFRVAD